MGLNIISSIFDNFFSNIRKMLKEKADEIERKLIKKMALVAAAIILVFLGIFQLSVGAAKYFTTILGNEAASYSLVGVLLVLGGIVLLLVALPKR